RFDNSKSVVQCQLPRNLPGILPIEFDAGVREMGQWLGAALYEGVEGAEQRVRERPVRIVGIERVPAEVKRPIVGLSERGLAFQRVLVEKARLQSVNAQGFGEVIGIVPDGV